MIGKLKKKGQLSRLEIITNIIIAGLLLLFALFGVLLSDFAFKSNMMPLAGPSYLTWVTGASIILTNITAISLLAYETYRRRRIENKDLKDTTKVIALMFFVPGLLVVLASIALVFIAFLEIPWGNLHLRPFLFLDLGMIFLALAGGFYVVYSIVSK